MRDQLTSLDKIAGYLQGEIKTISPVLLERLEKIDVADVCLRNGNPPKRVAAILMKRFKGTSRASAYRYINDAKYVYGSTSKTDREYWRSIIVENILETRRRAMADGNYKIAAACDANLIKATGVDRDDPEMPDFGKIQPPIQIIQLDPEFLERFGSMIDPAILGPLQKLLNKTKIPRFQLNDSFEKDSFTEAEEIDEEIEE